MVRRVNAMTDAHMLWNGGPIGRRPAPLADRGPTRTAILAIAGLSLLAWTPLAVPLLLLLR